jgi:hypothetical protein
MFLVNFSWVQEQQMHHSARLGRSLKPISARIRTSGAVRTPLIFTISFAQRYKMDYGSTELSGFTVKAHQSSSARKITKTNSRISNRQYKKKLLDLFGLSRKREKFILFSVYMSGDPKKCSFEYLLFPE